MDRENSDSSIIDPKDKIDIGALDFMLLQFRYVEQAIHDHLRELDGKARSSFTIASIITTAFTLKFGGAGWSDDFEVTAVTKVLVFFFILGLLFTFGSGLRAMQLRAAPITPNPYTTWYPFVTKSEDHFKYAITKEMAKNHSGIKEVVLRKERFVQFTNYGLAIQIAALGVLVMISALTTENSMPEANSQSQSQSQSQTNESSSSSPTPEASSSQQESQNQFAGSSDGIDMSVPLKKSNDGQAQTRDVPLTIRKNK